MSRDLVVLVPDKHIEQTFLGLLGRPKSLGIRSIDATVLVHANRDPGCYHTGHEVLALYASSYQHGLVVFDREWDGAPSPDSERLAADVEQGLKPLWKERARCVVIVPEIETWVWSDSPHVDDALGWKGRDPGLRQWLASEGLWPGDAAKPGDPKRALQKALKAVKLPPSSAIFRRLAGTVGFHRCSDPAFKKVWTILKSWFSEGSPPVTSSP